MVGVDMRRVRPPGPKGRPVAGVLFDLMADPLHTLRDATRYGDVVGLPILGQTVYFLSHPEHIKHVLVDNAHNYRKGPALRATRRLTGRGVLTSEGEAHKRQRHLAAPAFHRQRVAEYAALMAEETERHIAGWQPGETRDVHREMMTLTMKVVARCLYSADVSHEAERLASALGGFIDDFSPIDITPMGQWLEKLPTPRQRRRERNARTLDETIYRIIDERRASGEMRGDLLSLLLQAAEAEVEGNATASESEKKQMSSRQVRDSVMTLFLAGQETTGPALTWTFYLLSQDPEVESRLEAELDAVLRRRLPTVADVPRLSYVRMVFAESLRLYPPAWGMSRRALVEDEIGGYRIPAGATVVMSQYVMQRHAAYWDAPDEFRPTRFTPELESRLPRFTYFPFGGGPRLCLGEQFAWMEGVLLIATIRRCFRLSLVPGVKVEPIARMSIRLRHGLPMVINRR